MLEIFRDIIIPAAAVLGAIIGGATTIYIYYRNSQLKKAEWLYGLFDKFFYECRYAEMRRLIDYAKEEDIAALKHSIKHKHDVDLEEKLVEFLNFFEFISSLWKLRQLTLDEIDMMFNYYICRLGDFEFLNTYMQETGFEGLIELIAAIKQKE